MTESIKEKYTESLPEPITLKATEKILDQMNNGICRIFNNNKNGTGFFVKIPYKKYILPVLITNSQVINIDDILNKSIISIYINNDKSLKKIKLDNNRKIYLNEKSNITIIEIKEEDKLNNKYLELDDNIINYFKLNKNEKLYYLNNIYYNESIYIFNYVEDNDILVSYGKLLYFNKNELYCHCNINENSSGLPILLTYNQKLIGINNNNQNIRIINSFEQYYREHNYMKYEIEYENEFEIKENCEIRINDELIPFSYFHKFKKKGIYKIKYNFLLNITKTDFISVNAHLLQI